MTKKVVAVIKVTLGKARGRVQRGRGVVESVADARYNIVQLVERDSIVPKLLGRWKLRIETVGLGHVRAGEGEKGLHDHWIEDPVVGVPVHPGGG